MKSNWSPNIELMFALWIMEILLGVLKKPIMKLKGICSIGLKSWVKSSYCCGPTGHCGQCVVSVIYVVLCVMLWPFREVCGECNNMVRSCVSERLQYGSCQSVLICFNQSDWQHQTICSLLCSRMLWSLISDFQFKLEKGKLLTSWWPNPFFLQKVYLHYVFLNI